MLLALSVTSYYVFDHVNKRINDFFDPSADRYQIDLSLKAFKSGGFFGKGPAQGFLKDKIPDANTDFIFAVAGEELGFVGVALIIMLFVTILVQGLKIANKSSDEFGSILATGIPN